MNIKILTKTISVLIISNIIISKGEITPKKSTTTKTQQTNKTNNFYEKKSGETSKITPKKIPVVYSTLRPTGSQKIMQVKTTTKSSPQDFTFNPINTKSLDLKNLTTPDTKNISQKKSDLGLAQDLINNKINADKEYQRASENYQKSRSNFDEKTKLAQTRKIAFEKKITATRSLAEYSNKGKEKNLEQVRTEIETSLGKNPSKINISQNLSIITDKIKTALGLQPTVQENLDVKKIVNQKISFIPKNPTKLQVQQFIQDCIDAFKNLGKKNEKIYTKLYENGIRTETKSILIEQNDNKSYFEKSSPARLEIVTTQDKIGNISSIKENILDAHGYVLQETIYNGQGLISSKTTPNIFSGGGLDRYEYTYNKENFETGRTRTRTYADGRPTTITQLDKNDQPITRYNESLLL